MSSGHRSQSASAAWQESSLPAAFNCSTSSSGSKANPSEKAPAGATTTMMDDLSALVMLAYPTLFTKHLASEFVRDYIANVSHITLSAALSHYIQQHHIDQVPLAALQSEPSNAVQALRNKVLNNDANNECTKSALKVWVQRSTVQKSVDGQPLTVPVYRWSTMEPVQAAEPAVNKVKREAPIPVRPAPTISSSGRKLKKPKLLIHDQSVAVVKREQSSKRHDTVPNKKRKLAHSQTSNVSKPVNKAVPVSASVSVNAAPTSSAVTRLRSLPPVTRPWSNDEKVTLYQLIDKRHTYRHVAHLVQRSVEDVERTYMQLCGEPYADEHGYRLFVVGAVLEERYNKAKHRQEYLVHWTGYEAARDSWEPRSVIQDTGPYKDYLYKQAQKASVTIKLSL